MTKALKATLRESRIMKVAMFRCECVFNVLVLVIDEDDDVVRTWLLMECTPH